MIQCDTIRYHTECGTRNRQFSRRDGHFAYQRQWDNLGGVANDGSVVFTLVNFHLTHVFS